MKTYGGIANFMGRLFLHAVYTRGYTSYNFVNNILIGHRTDY